MPRITWLPPLLCLVFCSLAACSSTGGASGPVGPELTTGPGSGPGSAPGVEHVLPTEMCRDFFLVAVTLAAREGAPEDDAGRTLHLLFDTGASITVVDPDALERVSGRRVAARRRVDILEADAGAAHWNRLPVRTHELDHLGHALNVPFDGILGFTAFDDVLLTLDYTRSEMRVSTGGLPPPDGVAVWRYRADPRPFLRVDAGGQRRHVLIDSGSSGTLTLGDTDGLAWLTEPVTVSTSMRFDSLEFNDTGRLDEELRIGPLVFDDPLVDLTDGTTLVGTQMLTHAVLTFDQRARRVRILPAGPAGPIRMEPLRRSGASFHPRAEGLEVVHLVAGSSAERAGLAKGDMVVAIDGRPMAELGCLRQRLDDDEEVQQRTFRVRRGDDHFDTIVALEVLVP